MLKFNQLWQWLSGKKTKIAAAFYVFQDMIIPIWFEGGVPTTLDRTLRTIAVVLVSVGLGHAAVKGVSKK